MERPLCVIHTKVKIMGRHKNRHSRCWKKTGLLTVWCSYFRVDHIALESKALFIFEDTIIPSTFGWVTYLAGAQNLNLRVNYRSWSWGGGEAGLLFRRGFILLNLIGGWKQRHSLYGGIPTCWEGSKNLRKNNDTFCDLIKKSTLRLVQQMWICSIAIFHGGRNEFLLVMYHQNNFSVRNNSP